MIRALLTSLRASLLERTGLNSYAAGEYYEAERAFRKVLKMQSDRPGARHNLALALLGKGTFAKAEELLLLELNDYGDHYPRLRVLGDLYYQWGKPDEAAAMYQRATADDCPASDRQFLYRRIVICSTPHLFEDALCSRDAFVEGNRCMENDRMEEAIRSYRLAVEKDATNISAWNNLGTVLLNHMSDPEGAAEAFSAALELQPVSWIKANHEKAQSAISQVTVANTANYPSRKQGV